MSRRAITQATRFGVEFLSPQQVNKIELKDNYKILHLADGAVVNTRAVVISTGVDYQKLENGRLPEFAGVGVYYGAATTEAAGCSKKQVYVVGGGNSAGQAAMYLSQFVEMVRIVIRKPDLTLSMSSYLIDQIHATSNIEILPFTEIINAAGKEQLEKVTLSNRNTKEEEQVNCDVVFVFIGAKPYTEWLEGSIMMDKRGFIYRGKDLQNSEDFAKIWKEEKAPFILETCIPGVFAVGDVRSGAMNRVASAVGEGSMGISLVHRYLYDN